MGGISHLCKTGELAVMNLDYALTDQEEKLTLSYVPEKASTPWLPDIKAWKEVFDMSVVEMIHETQKTGFEFQKPKDRRCAHNTLSPAYCYRSLNSPYT